MRQRALTRGRYRRGVCRAARPRRLHRERPVGFSLEAAGLEALDGRTLWALVLDGPPVPVRLQGTVTDGAIDLSCPRAIPKLYYVHVAVIADTDGIVGCSPGDRVLVRDSPILIQQDVEVAFWDEESWGERARTDAEWVASRPTVGDWSDLDVCGYVAH